MPELPEVETAKETLKTLVLGKKIQSVAIFWPKIIKHPNDIEKFKQLVIGQSIHDIRRRGKFILFILDDVTLVSHLRMEGRYRLAMLEEPVDQHTHVIFKFEDTTELRYRDVRKFGTMHVFPKGVEESVPPLVALGPEPLTEQFDVSYLVEQLKKKKRPIKSALLDQTLLVGLGNIYVDEALFKAGIHPLTKACDLTEQEVSKLVRSIKKTLDEAVQMGGSTIRSYVNSQGQMGMFQQQLDVYGREGEACHQCGTIIEKFKVGGRGTHICPNCQRREGSC